MTFRNHRTYMGPGITNNLQWLRVAMFGIDNNAPHRLSYVCTNKYISRVRTGHLIHS